VATLISRTQAVALAAADDPSTSSDMIELTARQQTFKRLLIGAPCCETNGRCQQRLLKEFAAVSKRHFQEAFSKTVS